MSWVMTQTWNELLFAHWPVKPNQVEPFLPKGLELDTYDGAAWIGVVPFHMSNIRFRGLPRFPYTTAFPELNVRTYVRHGDKRGVYFFSLDAAHRPAVWGARKFFHLPYYHASIQVERASGKTVHYKCVRVDTRGEPAAFHAEYRPVSGVYLAENGMIEHWLTERYCLFTTNRQGKLLRGDIRHEPWPLQKAEADIALNTMAEASQFKLPNQTPLLHYAHHLKVYLWNLVDAKSGGVRS